MIVRRMNRHCSSSVVRRNTFWPGRRRQGSASSPRLLNINTVPTQGITCSHGWSGITLLVNPTSSGLLARSTRCFLGTDYILKYITFCSSAYNAVLPNKVKSPSNSDDEAKDIGYEVIHLNGEEFPLEEGEFFDTPYHRDRKIQLKDVGRKVNVGEPVISELKRLFQINREKALRMVRPSKFLLVSDGSILRTLHFLKDHDITSSQIQRIPWVLLHSADSLHQKFEKLTEPHLFQNCSEGLGFCGFTLNHIVGYQKYFVSEAKNFPQHPNRIYYLAEKLKVPVAHLTEKIIGPRQILSMDMKRLEHMIDVFHAYGVKPEDILSDLWVFCHNAKLIEERLQRAIECGSERPKPWICHSAPDIFERYCERYRSQKLLLGDHKDVISYLAERLECEQRLVAIHFQRNPGLKRMHITNLKKKLDLLFSEGFTPENVRSCPRVLQYSEQRILNRIKELKEIGYFPFPIAILYKNSRTYSKIIQQYKDGKYFVGNKKY